MRPRNDPPTRAVPTCWFVDETKRSRLLVVAVVVPVGDQASLRKALRAQLHPGQRSLHFTKESPSTRRAVLDVITASTARYRTYQAERALRPAAAREMCLRALARDAMQARPRRILIEKDDSEQARDERWLREELGPRPGRSIEFCHLSKHEEPLLWVADAIAWCLQRGQPWTGMIASMADAEDGAPGQAARSPARQPSG